MNSHKKTNKNTKKNTKKTTKRNTKKNTHKKRYYKKGGSPASCCVTSKSSAQPSTRINSNVPSGTGKSNIQTTKNSFGIAYKTTGGSATKKQFSYILNPVTNRKVKTTSRLGKQLLKRYLIQMGGDSVITGASVPTSWIQQFANFFNGTNLSNPPLLMTNANKSNIQLGNTDSNTCSNCRSLIKDIRGPQL